MVRCRRQSLHVVFDFNAQSSGKYLSSKCPALQPVSDLMEYFPLSFGVSGRAKQYSLN